MQNAAIYHAQTKSVASAASLLSVFLVTYCNSSMNAAETIDFHGYPNCILLQNEMTRVVLCPEAGGRVLEYSLNGKNSLYLNEEVTGQPYQPGQPAMMSAGRFDIGPEKLIPKRDALWSGKWQGEITGDRAARLTSQEHAKTGVQLIRDFELAAEGSELKCTQTIRNISDRQTQWCHWSRTFAMGKGIVVIPLAGHSKFPNQYVMYEDGDRINIKPTDDRIRQRDGFLEILSAPAKPKLGMDSSAGWFAYAAPNDLLFVKSYTVYPDRVYNEVAGLTISIWYPQDRDMVELEPIGPREVLAPGESSSFTETWELFAFEYPAAESAIDLQQIQAIAGKLEE